VCEAANRVGATAAFFRISFAVRNALFSFRRRIAFIFSNVSGFTPYSRLNITALASSAFFPFLMPSVYHFYG
jgi:hypothetical protein